MITKCDDKPIYIPPSECEDCSVFEEELHAVENRVTVVEANKQDKLIAGDNITIDSNNVISATGGGGGGHTYHGGTNIVVDNTTHEISAPNVATKTELNTVATQKQDKLTAGDGITISAAGVIAAMLNATNTYTKTEVNDLLAALNHLTLEVKATKPATGEDNILYLIGNDTDGYEQWVYVNNAWVDLGGTDVDLSQYLTIAQLEAQYQKKLTAGSRITIGTDNKISADAVTEAEILTALGYSKMVIKQEEDDVVIGQVEVIGKDTTPVTPPTP